VDVAAEEYRRLDLLLGMFDPEDWARPTDCAPWDVHDVVAHLVGAADAATDTRERLHQLVQGVRRRRRGDLLLIDAMNAVQVADRADHTPAHLPTELRESAKLSIRARRRIPHLVRAAPIPLGQPLGVSSLDRLLGCIYTRDAWMHRIDLQRATGHHVEVTADHDGLIVADAVGEWAATHKQPFNLHLTGPAGGSWSRISTTASAAEAATWTMDAQQFCRILSGRDHASGVLATRLVF
jgi:uncharacterized protein (TIGR03083 family)